MTKQLLEHQKADQLTFNRWRIVKHVEAAWDMQRHHLLSHTTLPMWEV